MRRACIWSITTRSRTAATGRIYGRTAAATSWRGSISVIGATAELGLRIFIVADTIDRIQEIEVTRSAYLWDAEGLKHRYRTTSSGDCTSYIPPRIVIPSLMLSGKVYTKDYRYMVFSPTAELRFAVDVRQHQQVIRAEAAEAAGRRFDDCPLIETTWSDTYADGAVKSHRKAVCDAKDVGPVQIAAEIPQHTPALTGELTGKLVDYAN